MKKIFVAVLIPSVCFAQANDPFSEAPDNIVKIVEEVPQIFRVSQAQQSKEKQELFRRLWDALQFKEPETAGKKAKLWILQALGPSNGMHLYIAEYMGKRVAVLLENGELLPEKSVQAWVEEHGVYDGRTVLGAATRVPRYRELKREERADAPIKEDFLAKLKEGGDYTVKIRVSSGCKTCFGDGKLGAMQGRKDCSACNGDGSSLQTWILKW